MNILDLLMNQQLEAEVISSAFTTSPALRGEPHARPLTQASGLRPVNSGQPHQEGDDARHRTGSGPARPRKCGVPAEPCCSQPLDGTDLTVVTKPDWAREEKLSEQEKQVSLFIFV